jgi:hypothetical protein
MAARRIDMTERRIVIFRMPPSGAPWFATQLEDPP